MILASLPGFFEHLVVPKPWIGLLGLLPIAIGLDHPIHRETDEGNMQTICTAITLFVLIGLGLFILIDSETYKLRLSGS